jgi:hypothetical protein
MSPYYSFLPFGPVALAARLNLLWNFLKPASSRPTPAQLDPPGVSPSSGLRTAASCICMAVYLYTKFSRH